MQKDTIFTPTSFLPKLFYPKKCVNYNKSEVLANSNVPGNATKNREIATLLTFLTKQSEILQRFSRDRIFFTPTLLARWYDFSSLRWEAAKSGRDLLVDHISHAKNN